jgi:diguanylate cyclase (GGDEF)-like protein/putative nucleotidyltransferase with HDIG domain
MSDDELVGFTIFGGVSSGAARGTADVAYIESATAIVSIAIKNAMLYRRIEDEANRDSLTNLYNRRHFIQRIRGDFDAGSVVSMTLAIISFDDFRLYNELYGSYEGDRIIKSFAEILLGAVKGKGTVARLGGKEFILALPFHDPAQARELLARIKDMLEQRLGEVAEHGIRYLTFSAGICEYPSSATNFDELMTYANMALYTAKCSGKNRFEEYSPVHFDEFERQRLDMEYKKSIAENCEPTILALVAAIDAKDHYTFRHSINVSEYASALARAISLDSVHVEMIRQAGLMHDVGKIGISDSILSKQSELTDEEYEIMKQHVDGSIAMIRHIPSLDYVIPIAIGHHERWDGKGYPRGLSGDEIPIGARCLCIADSFDAMITRRPYREGLSVEHALEEIKNGLGAQYDPDLGKVFISLVRSGAINIKLQNEAV